MNAVIRLSNGI